METFLSIIGALGGVAILIVLLIVLVIFLFKKQLNPFFENLFRVRFKEFEINSGRGSQDVEQPIIRSNLNEHASEQVSASLESEITDNIEDEEDNSLNKLLEAWLNNEKEAMKEAYVELQNEESINDNKLKNEAIYYSLLFRMGDDSIQNFESIEKKAEHTEVFGDIMNIISKAYELMENYDIAIKYYKKGLENLENSNQVYGILIRGLAFSDYMIGKKDEAVKLLIDSMNLTSSLEEKFEYFVKMAEIYKMDKKIDFQISSLEKALEIKPNDKSLLFDLAYAYLHNNQQKLALLHYKHLVQMDPSHSDALNNLGVIYSNLDLEIKKIDSYKKAFEIGHTLAASNLAYDLINIGLKKEATDILEQANYQHEDVHENVKKAQVFLQEKVKDEDIKENEDLEEARKQRVFEKNLASARFEASFDEEINLDGEWKLDNKFDFIIEIKTDLITIIGSKNNKKIKFEGIIDKRYISLECYEMEYKLPYIHKEEIGFKKTGIAVGYIKDFTNIFIKDNNIEKNRMYYNFRKIES